MPLAMAQNLMTTLPSSFSFKIHNLINISYLKIFELKKTYFGTEFAID